MLEQAARILHLVRYSFTTSLRTPASEAGLSFVFITSFHRLFSSPEAGINASKHRASSRQDAAARSLLMKNVHH
ncbi:MAG: hypothetical protein OXC07_06210 [Kistimonas sp.]|nr:hypothetical protein [Kistimonas sp.]